MIASSFRSRQHGRRMAGQNPLINCVPFSDTGAHCCLVCVVCRDAYNDAALLSLRYGTYNAYRMFQVFP